MEIINDHIKFNSIKEKISLLIKLNVKFPQQIFVDIGNFAFIEFTEISTKSFYNSIININKSDFVFYSILPDPKEYYFHYFNRYSVFEFISNDSPKEYLNNLHKKPDGFGADAIMDVVEEFVIYSKDIECVIYGDRDFDLAIAGFRHLNQKLKFIQDFGKEKVYSFEELKNHLCSEFEFTIDDITTVKEIYFNEN